MFRRARVRSSVAGVYRRTNEARLCFADRFVIQTITAFVPLRVEVSKMNLDEARETLAFSEYARKRARDDMRRPWLGLVLLASLSVVSLSLPDAATSALGLFWAFAGPLGAGAIAVYSYRRNRSSGIDSSPLAYVAITVGLLILSYTAGKIGFAFQVPGVSRFGPAFIAAAGYFVLAWIERSWMVGAISFALLAVTVAIIGFDLSSQQSKALLFGLYGITLLGVGFSWRVGRKEILGPTRAPPR